MGRKRYFRALIARKIACETITLDDKSSIKRNSTKLIKNTILHFL